MWFPLLVATFASTVLIKFLFNPFTLVVTGATDGIGKEESQYKVKTKWIAVDFAKGREVYDQIEKELAGIDVGILGK